MASQASAQRASPASPASAAGSASAPRGATTAARSSRWSWRSAAACAPAGDGTRAHCRGEGEVGTALMGPPRQTTLVLCEVARLRAATGELDTAAARLEQAFLLALTHRLAARARRVLAVRRELPSGAAAVRQLDDILRGSHVTASHPEPAGRTG